MATAVDGSEIVALIAELEEFTFNEVFPVSVDKDVDNFESALLTSPIAEIAVFFASIVFWILSSCGAFSASTRLSTICVMFPSISLIRVGGVAPTA